jgi:sucrose phosphorylase
LNITLFDALSDPQSDESERLKIDRFMASQAIMLALAGVPGIYAHSLVGSSNNYEGFKETGRARTLNREKWQRARLEANLAAPGSRAAQVFGRYVDLLKVRASTPAFHPNGAQQIVPGNSGVFALLRTSSEGSHKVLCVHNISARPQLFEAEAAALGFTGPLVDMLSGQPAPRAGGALRLNLVPYQAAWLAQNKP